MKLIRTRVFFATLRSVLTKHVSEGGVTNIFLLFVLAVITFYPLFSVGFTTHDDVDIAINEWSGLTWEVTKLASVSQGRFVFFWGSLLSRVPFIIDSRIWYLAFKFGSFFILISALYYAVSKLFRSSWIALTSIAIFFSILQNGWDHNALTSYAFVFNAYVTLFLLSLGLFATAIDRKSLALASLSGVLYFFALGTELFVLFFPFYVAVVLLRVNPEESVIRRLKLGKNYILAIALPLMVYLMLYLIWRTIHPSNYNGNILIGSNLLAAAKVIATYSLTAFPLASLHFYAAPGDPLPFANSVGFRAILSELNVAHIIKPAIIGFIFIRLMTRTNFIVPQAKTLVIGAIFACVGIFLPNILLGFTEKHQNWVSGGTYSYLYTYYSFISMVVFFALILAYANVKSRAWHPRLRRALISLVVAVIMILGFAVEVRNQYFAFDQKLTHRKWQLMDVVINSPAFTEIPDGSIVVAPTLLSPYRGIAAVLAGDWSNYVKYKTGKKIQFDDNSCKGEKQCYTLVFRQEPQSDNQFIVLEKMNHLDSLVSDKLTIYSMPTQANAVIIGSFIPGDVVPKLEINGAHVVNVGVGLFSSNSPRDSGNGLAQIISVTGNVDIIPERITISHYNVEPRLLSLSDEFAEGIDFKKPDYPDFLAEVSGLSVYEWWGRWTDAAAGSVAKFRFKHPLPRKFTLEISAGAFGPNMGAPVKVRVGGVEKIFVITPKMREEPCRLVFETDGTVDSLEIMPPSPTSPNEIDPKNPDTRKLGIGLISLKFKTNPVH